MTVVKKYNCTVTAQQMELFCRMDIGIAKAKHELVLLKLKEIVSRHIAKDFSVSSTRAGNIPGAHRVGFDGLADQILLEHSARSREGFASGAILAAEWIVGKKGFYEFTDVLEALTEK